MNKADKKVKEYTMRAERLLEIKGGLEKISDYQKIPVYRLITEIAKMIQEEENK